MPSDLDHSTKRAALRDERNVANTIIGCGQPNTGEDLLRVETHIADNNKQLERNAFGLRPLD